MPVHCHLQRTMNSQCWHLKIFHRESRFIRAWRFTRPLPAKKSESLQWLCRVHSEILVSLLFSFQETLSDYSRLDKFFSYDKLLFGLLYILIFSQFRAIGHSSAEMHKFTIFHWECRLNRLNCFELADVRSYLVVETQMISWCGEIEIQVHVLQLCLERHENLTRVGCRNLKSNWHHACHFLEWKNNS